MIQIKITNTGRAIRLEAKGHAQTADPGYDLICAGVSALIYGYAGAVDTIPRAKTTGGVIDVGRKDGYALIEVSCKDQKTYKRVRAFLEPVYHGLRVLHKSAPTAISIQVVEP